MHSAALVSTCGPCSHVSGFLLIIQRCHLASSGVLPGPHKGMKFYVIFSLSSQTITLEGKKSLEEGNQGEGGWNTLCFRQIASVSLEIEYDFFKKGNVRDFPGGPVVKAPRFHCRRHGLHPWPRNKDPSRRTAWSKKKKKKKECEVMDVK